MIPKFRAWLKEENKMIEPSDILSISFKLCEMTPNYLHGFEKEKYDFYDLELMQSTGFKDKNGKEIFEGDILGTKDGLLNGVVEYRADLGMFVNTLIRYNNFERLCNIGSDREIIGNVWEDGDLIDSKKTREN